MTTNAKHETGDAGRADMGTVTILCARKGEVYLLPQHNPFARDPLSFVAVPAGAEYDRKRFRETYLLPYGTRLLLCDGFAAQTVIVASGVKDGAVNMKAARALGAVAAG